MTHEIGKRCDSNIGNPMEDHEDHREDTRYVPITRQQILEDDKYKDIIVESFMEALCSHDGTAERKVMEILHYLLRATPDYSRAGAVLEETVFPAMNKLIFRIQEEHLNANTDWSNDPNK